MPEALHYSTGKSGVDQIPPEVLMEWGDVFTYGAKKYARDNWRGGTDWSQMYGSALRHIFKFWAGEDYDNCDGSPGCAGEDADFCKIHSRTHHLAQAIWNLGAIRYWQIHDKGNDDRDPVPTTVKVERPVVDGAAILDGQGNIVGSTGRPDIEAFDYIVGANGTHDTLFGPVGALADAMKAGGAKRIYVMSDHTEVVAKTTDLVQEGK